MLPSPVQVAEAFIKEFPALMENARITLAEAGMGLVLGIATGFGAAVLMDRFDKAYKADIKFTLGNESAAKKAEALFEEIRGLKN